jgi:uncharacterized protein (DUF362 family)
MRGPRPALSRRAEDGEGRVKRRDFLGYGVGSGLLAAAGAAGLVRPRWGIASGTPDIAVVKGDTVAATRAAVDLLGGMKTFVKPGNRVVIKPNMSFDAPPERANNTHPLVVREVAAMCREAGAVQVQVLDHTLDKPKACLEKSGIPDACQGMEGVLVRSINEDKFYTEVDLPKGVTLSRSPVAKDVLQADVLIAVPVAKSHSFSTVSLSMKGMMGLVYSRKKMHFLGLDECIADLCTMLRPHLVVIDGSRVLSTKGPGGAGKVLEERTIIASRDMVAADACAVSLFEWYGRKHKPEEIGHIVEAHKRGLGHMDWENLAVNWLVL